MRNDTLRKKIMGNIVSLEARIAPYVSELNLNKALLAQLDAHEQKVVGNAEEALGI